MLQPYIESPTALSYNFIIIIAYATIKPGVDIYILTIYL